MVPTSVMYKTRKTIRRFWANRSLQKPIIYNPQSLMVSFTFDDAPASAFQNGGAILQKHGYKGTFYISFSFLHPSGVEPNKGFTLNDLQQALKNISPFPNIQDPMG